MYWHGVEYPRKSEAYQELLTRAYDALFTSKSFRDALAAAGDASFTHSLGGKKQNQTILTASEFIGQLNRLRLKLKAMKSKEKDH